MVQTSKKGTNHKKYKIPHILCEPEYVEFIRYRSGFFLTIYAQNSIRNGLKIIEKLLEIFLF
jgi:hypothetical protein